MEKKKKKILTKPEFAEALFELRIKRVLQLLDKNNIFTSGVGTDVEYIKLFQDMIISSSFNDMYITHIQSTQQYNAKIEEEEEKNQNLEKNLPF